MGELLKRVRDLIEDIRWEDAANPSRWVQFLRGQVRLYFYVARETVRDHCPQRASALTFTTLLSLVPLMAVAFSLFRAFPAFQGLEKKAERAILHTMLSDVFVEGARVPVGADASPDQALDDGAEGGGSATDLLRRADEHPRMAASRAALELYLDALIRSADAAEVRRGLATLYLDPASGVRERLAEIDRKHLVAYAGAADAPPPPEEEGERLKEGRAHFKQARILADAGDFAAALEQLRAAESARYPFGKTRKSMALIHMREADQLKRSHDLDPVEHWQGVVDHYLQATLCLTDALVLGASEISDVVAWDLTDEHATALEELAEARLELGRQEVDYALTLAETDQVAGEQAMGRALGDLREAVLLMEGSERRTEANVQLAKALVAAGRKDDALRQYERALEREEAFAAVGVSTVVVDTIHKLSAGMGDARFTVIGILFLVVAATSLFSTIEKTLNHIWQVQERRPLWIKFTSFCTLVLLGPALIAASILVRERLAYTMEVFFEDVPILGPVFTVVAAVGQHVLPFIMLWVVLLTLFRFLPHTKVRLSAAAWGAFVGTVLLQLARPIFRIYVTKLIMGSSRFKIYGSLGAIPLLMLWLWLLWLIVLFGAEVAFTFQNVGLLRFRDKLSRFSRLYIDGFLAARIVMYVGRHFWRDGEPAPVEDLAETLNISPEEAKDAARRLVDLDLLTPVGEELELYHPARDLSKLKVIDVLTASDRLRHQSRSGKEEDRPYEDRLEAVFHSVIESRRTALRDMTFRDLLESCEAQSPSPPAQQPAEAEQDAG